MLDALCNRDVRSSVQLIDIVGEQTRLNDIAKLAVRLQIGDAGVSHDGPPIPCRWPTFQILPPLATRSGVASCHRMCSPVPPTAIT